MNNLGRLLGIITLSRNQPILFEALDLKSLLVNIKKDKTELDFILPFVSKILESCANSKASEKLDFKNIKKINFV